MRATGMDGQGAKAMHWRRRSGRGVNGTIHFCEGESGGVRIQEAKVEDAQTGRSVMRIENSEMSVERQIMRDEFSVADYLS